MKYPSDHIHFRTNIQKALEVILWCAEKEGRPVEFHTVLKVLFCAEAYHLNEYGRPVVGDTYNALQYGPVAQTTYDLLKGEPLALDELGTETLPFIRVGAYRVRPSRAPDLSVFSKSDVEALEHGWSEYGNLSFHQRTNKSHDHKAYRNAALAGRQTMDYADFLDADHSTDEIKADLAEVAGILRL